MTQGQAPICRRTRILLADDHPIFRAGVRRVVEQAPGLEVLAEVGDGASCVAQAAILKPDLIIADVSMPHMSGFDVGEWLRGNLPGCRLIMISMHSASGFVEKAKQVGASGFVAKEDAADELLAAIKAEHGSFYTSASIGGNNSLNQSFMAFEASQEDLEFSELINGLTRSELRVLQMLSQSLTSRDIAAKLGISPRTVQAHRLNISKKFDLRGPNKLLELAIRHRDRILG